MLGLTGLVRVRALATQQGQALLLLNGATPYCASEYGTETAAVTSTADAGVRDRVAAYAAAARELNATLVLDASYATDDQEQLDTVWLDTVLRNTGTMT